jgi:hypothetical protein
MAVFIEVTTDAFQERFDKIAKGKKQSRRAGADNVRRPLRGLEVKDDTYGIIKVITSNGEEIPLVDSSDSRGTSESYSNFIIQSVNEARMEKHQIVETFGESYIFFFGEAPRFLDVQCVLIDSHDFNWYAEFWENYNRYFRGTKLVEMGARAYLFYDDNIVEGYMLNATAVKTSEAPLMVQLSFRLYLTNYSNISLIGDPNFPVRGSLILPPGVDDINQLPQDRGKYLATLGANLQNAGFGGGEQFQKAFSQGGSFADVPEQLYGVFLNAIQALGELDTRSIDRQLTPLRSKISDNNDEYTLPSGSLTTGEEDLHNELYDVEDLVNQMLEELKKAGASADNSHKMFQQLGLGPYFFPWGQQGGVGATASASVSFSARVGASVSASFGVSARAGAQAGASFSAGAYASAGASFGARASASAFAGASIGGRVGGGIGGGLGFSGRAGLGGGFNPQAPYAPNYAKDPTLSKRSAVLNDLNRASFGNQVDFNYFESFNQNPNYNNGVRTGGGLTMGVGIAGGIGKPFDVQTFSGSGPLPPGFPGMQPAPFGAPFGTNPSDPGGYAGAFGSPQAQGPDGYPNGSFPIGYNSAYGTPYGSPYQPGNGPPPPGFGPGFSNPYLGPGNGGASVQVGGTPTAFAMVSTGGQLTPNGWSYNESQSYYYTF